MPSPRMSKLQNLGIGKDGPNILIPVLYGSLSRILNNKISSDLDKKLNQIITEKKIDTRKLNNIVQKYESIPDQVKRGWSGKEYRQLTEPANIDILKKHVTELTLTVVKQQYYKFGNQLIPKEKLRLPGFQPPIVIPPSIPPRVERPRLPVAIPGDIIITIPTDSDCCCKNGGTSSDQGSSTPPGTTPVPQPTSTYMWELGPSLRCDYPLCTSLGDDLYAVYAWADASGGSGIDQIDVTPGTEDLDAGESGTWPLPKRVIYNGRKPNGYLHIEIAIFEKDYTLDVIVDLIPIIAALGGTIGGLAAGPAGAAIGAGVGQALNAAKSLINAADDDNYLGTLIFDYPNGESDLNPLVGSRTLDWYSDVESGVHYEFDYVIRKS